MVPSGFVAMEAIPLTANGKVDREALPMPEEKQINSEWVGPRNSNEQILTAIWKRVLGVKRWESMIISLKLVATRFSVFKSYLKQVKWG